MRRSQTKLMDSPKSARGVRARVCVWGSGECQSRGEGFKLQGSPSPMRSPLSSRSASRSASRNGFKPASLDVAWEDLGLGLGFLLRMRGGGLDSVRFKTVSTACHAQEFCRESRLQAEDFFSNSRRDLEPRIKTRKLQRQQAPWQSNYSSSCECADPCKALQVADIHAAFSKLCSLLPTDMPESLKLNLGGAERCSDHTFRHSFTEAPVARPLSCTRSSWPGRK